MNYHWRKWICFLSLGFLCFACQDREKDLIYEGMSLRLEEINQYYLETIRRNENELSFHKSHDNKESFDIKIHNGIYDATLKLLASADSLLLAYKTSKNTSKIKNSLVEKLKVHQSNLITSCDTLPDHLSLGFDHLVVEKFRKYPKLASFSNSVTQNHFAIQSFKYYVLKSTLEVSEFLDPMRFLCDDHYNAYSSFINNRKHENIVGEEILIDMGVAFINTNPFVKIEIKETLLEGKNIDLPYGISYSKPPKIGTMNFTPKKAGKYTIEGTIYLYECPKKDTSTLEFRQIIEVE